MNQAPCSHRTHCHLQGGHALGLHHGLSYGLPCGLTIGLLAVLAGCGATRTTPPVLSGNLPAAATASVPSPPVLGYLWDAGRSALRPLFGIPGATHLATNSSTSGPFSAALPCVKRGFALMTDGDGAVSLASLPDGSATQISLQLSRNNASC